MERDLHPGTRVLMTQFLIDLIGRNETPAADVSTLLLRPVHVVTSRDIHIEFFMLQTSGRVSP